MDAKLAKASRIVITKCLDLRKHETCVVVTDEPCRAIGYALWKTARSLTDAILVEIPLRDMHGQEPPYLVAEILKKCDVFIIPTSRSLTHTRARIEASKSGARGATMPGITLDSMIRSLNADYGRIAAVTTELAHRVTKAKRARLITAKNSVLEFDLSERQCYLDTGIVRKPREFSNLPAGEAYIAPQENKTRGQITVDGSFAPFGALSKHVTLTLRNGQLVDIQGNDKAKALFRRYTHKERTLCELGIGTNPKAKITGIVLEDEKVRGSVHVAFGNNLGFGGRNKAGIHLDCVIRKPTLWLDENLVINKGILLI